MPIVPSSAIIEVKRCTGVRDKERSALVCRVAVTQCEDVQHRDERP